MKIDDAVWCGNSACQMSLSRVPKSTRKEGPSQVDRRESGSKCHLICGGRSTHSK